MIEGWNHERIAGRDQSRMILTHTNNEVRALNELARGKLRDGGALGVDVAIATERCARQFASGDRLMFLRSDRELSVKNGTLGQIEQVSRQRIAVRIAEIARKLPERAKSMFALFRTTYRRPRWQLPRQTSARTISVTPLNAMPARCPTWCGCASRGFRCCRIKSPRVTSRGVSSKLSGPRQAAIWRARSNASLN